MTSAYKEPDGLHDLNELSIVLLGVSGAGKSATANAILGREAFKESKTIESEIERGRVEDRNISITDTPGFFNTQLTDEEMKKQMMKSLYLSYPGPHVFLLVINLETFREEQRNIVEQIQENFGEDALLFTMVLFTGREKMSNREWGVFIDSAKFKELVNHCRGQYHVINSKTEINRIHITKLLEKIDEVIKLNDGQHYNKDIFLMLLKKCRNKSQVEEKQTVRQNEKEMKQEQVKPMRMLSQYSLMEETCGVIEPGKERFNSHVKETEINHEYEIFVLEENKNSDEEFSESLQTTMANLPEGKEEEHTYQMPKKSWMSQMKGCLAKEQSIQTVKSDLRFVLVGKTGAGKSASGNTILNQKVFEEKFSSESVTEKCQQHQQMVEGKIISVIDTPGLFDTKISKKQLKAEIEKCVVMSVPGPHAFLLVIRLDVRYTDEEKNAVKWIQKNFGEEAARYTIILFTRGDLLNTSIDKFLLDNMQINELVKRCRGGYHVFSNKDNKNRSQVTDLLEKIDRMVRKNGGEHYTNKMYKEAQRKIEEEEKKQREEEERKKKKEENMIRADERSRMKVSHDLPLVAAGIGATVAGSVAAAVSGGMIPVGLIAGGAVLAGGTGVKMIVNKVKGQIKKNKKGKK